MARVDQLFNYLQTPGLSDQQIAAEINRLGVTAQEVASLTGVPVADVQSRLATAAPTREQVLAAYAANPRAELNPSEASIQYWQNAGLGSFNSTVDAVRAENPALAAQIDAQRGVLTPTAAPTAAPTARPTAAPTAAPTARPTAAPTAAPTSSNFNQMILDAYGSIGRTGFGTNPNQIDQAGYDYFLNELNSGRVSPSDFNRVFNSAVSQYVQTRPTDPVTQAVTQYRPFANPGLVQTQPVSTGAPAVPGYQAPSLETNLAQYAGIPIGAQYNPGVTAGGASPYSQIMAQTPGFVNPYANVVAGLPMGGYNPNIYDPNLLSNFIKERASDAAAARGEAVAADAAMYAAFDGGLITKVMGPNPPTPDDGTMFVQKGEYIIKRDSVDKYGKGLLDMINEGKIPAKKIKSLLD